MISADSAPSEAMQEESIQQEAGSRTEEEAGRASKRRRVATHLGLTLPDDNKDCSNGDGGRADCPASPTLLETPSSHQVRGNCETKQLCASTLASLTWIDTLSEATRRSQLSTLPSVRTTLLGMITEQYPAFRGHPWGCTNAAQWLAREAPASLPSQLHQQIDLSIH